MKQGRKPLQSKSKGKEYGVNSKTLGRLLLIARSLGKLSKEVMLLESGITLKQIYDKYGEVLK